MDDAKPLTISLALPPLQDRQRQLDTLVTRAAKAARRRATPNGRGWSIQAGAGKVEVALTAAGDEVSVTYRATPASESTDSTLRISTALATVVAAMLWTSVLCVVAATALPAGISNALGTVFGGAALVALFGSLIGGVAFADRLVAWRHRRALRAAENALRATLAHTTRVHIDPQRSYRGDASEADREAFTKSLLPNPDWPLRREGDSWVAEGEHRGRKLRVQIDPDTDAPGWLVEVAAADPGKVPDEQVQAELAGVVEEMKKRVAG